MNESQGNVLNVRVAESVGKNFDPHFSSLRRIDGDCFERKWLFWRPGNHGLASNGLTSRVALRCVGLARDLCKLPPMCRPEPLGVKANVVINKR